MTLSSNTPPHPPPPKCPDNLPSSNNFNTFLPPFNNSTLNTPVKHLHVNIVLKDRLTTKAKKQNSTSRGPSSGISTHIKISQLVTSLQTSCQQAVFALLVPSCQQVVPNLLTTCNKLDENIRLVTRLF